MAASNTTTSMPTYVIYRETRAGEPFDPTSPPVFFPPKDSDELFDALRAKYPHLKSHSERMRDAIIEFLLEERQSEQSQTSPTIPSAPTITATSPWQSSWPSVSTTTLSSPETASIMTPMFGDSPPSHSGPSTMDRPFSANTGADSVEASPPALAQMTSVFSLSSTEQPKQRIRRKMTEAEKIEYRKRRIVKACDKCSKRKRKCHHNQPDMECVTSKPQRITKPSVTNKKAAHDGINPSVKTEPLIQVRPDLDMSDQWTGEFQTFDDFTALLEDPEMGVYDLFHPESISTSQEWQWPATEDFTLLDDVDSAIDYDMFQYSSDLTQSFTSQSPHDGRLWDQQAAASLQSGDSTPSFSSHSSRNSTIWESPQLIQTNDLVCAEPIRESPVPQHTLHTHTYDAIDAFVHDSPEAESLSAEISDSTSLQGPRVAHGKSTVTPRNGRRHTGIQSNSGVILEGPSTPNERPIRNAHSRLSLQSARTLSTRPLSPASISQVTWRLTGTAKAVRTLGRLLDVESPSRTRLMSVTVGTIARAATVPVHLQNGIARRPSTLQHGPFASARSNNGTSEEPSPRWKNLMNNYNSLSSTALSKANADNRASKAHLLGLEIDSLDKGSFEPEKTRTSLSSLANNPAPGNSRGMLQDGGTSTAQQGRSGLSLGGTSLDAVQPPMPQLPLLRRPWQQSIRLGDGAALAQSLVPSGLLQTTAVQDTTNAVASAMQNVRSYNLTVTSSDRLNIFVEANASVHTRPTGPSASGYSGGLVQRLQLQEQGGLTDERYRRKFPVIQASRFQKLSAAVLQTLLALVGLALLAATAWTVSDLRLGMSSSVVLLALLCPLTSTSGETGKPLTPSQAPQAKTLTIRSAACAPLALVC